MKSCTVQKRFQQSASPRDQIPSLRLQEMMLLIGFVILVISIAKTTERQAVFISTGVLVVKKSQWKGTSRTEVH